MSVHAMAYLKKIDHRRKRKPPAEWSESGKRSRMNDLLNDVSARIKELFVFDDYSLWSFTHLAIGDEICNELLKLDGITHESVITDAMSSIGGNTISFAKVFGQVNAIELDDDRRDMLEHNLDLCGITNVTVYASYYQSIMNTLTQDVIFIDPPWGINYRENPLARLTIEGLWSAMSLEELMNKLPPHKYCVVKLPFNYDMDHLRGVISGKIIRTLSYPRPNTCMFVIVENTNMSGFVNAL